MKHLVTIDEACEIVTDGTHYTPENAGTGIPFLTVKDVIDSKLDFINCSFITTDDYITAKEGNSAPRKGDVLFSKDGTVGKVHVVTTDTSFAVLSSLAILRPKKSMVDATYFGYVLRSPKVLEDALKRKTGSAIRRIILSDLKKVKVPLPSLEEQKRIADILDRAEALRAKRRAALAQLDELVQSIFIEMFGDPRSLTKERNSKLKLRDLIEIIVPTRDKPKKFTGNIPWITLPDFTNSIYIEDSKYKLSKEEAKPTKTRLFPKETVILSCAGSLGKVAIAVDEVYTNQQFYGLVCDKERIVPEFLAYYLLLLGEDYYRGISGTSILSFFKKESALNIEIVLPEMSNQIYFSQIVKQIEKIKQSQQQSLLEINSLFDSLTHEAFTGKLCSHKSFERQIEREVKI